MILAAICIIPALSAYLEGVLGIILLLFMSFLLSLHVWGKARAKISSLFYHSRPLRIAWGGLEQILLLLCHSRLVCISAARLVQGCCRYLRHSCLLCMSGDKGEEPFLSLFVSFPPSLHVSGRAWEKILSLFASFPPSSYAWGQAWAIIFVAICVIPARSAHFGSVLGNMLSLFVSFPPSLHVWGKARARILLLFVSFPPSLHSLGWSWGTDFVAICVIPALFAFLGQG